MALRLKCNKWGQTPCVARGLTPFVDLHCHMLPGLDDGAGSVEESLDMARISADGGTSVVVATPHCDFESAALEPRQVESAVAELNGRLERERIPLEIAAGMEVRVNTGLLDIVGRQESLAGLCLGQAARYMLVDLTLSEYPLAATDALFGLQLRGITPVLAHPERNRHLVERPDTVRELVRRGVELQVDSGSLEGIFGKDARRTGRRLLAEGAARLVASDAHDPRERNPDLSRASRIISGILGREAAEVLLAVNPRLALEGLELRNAARP